MCTYIRIEIDAPDPRALASPVSVDQSVNCISCSGEAEDKTGVFHDCEKGVVEYQL